MADRSKGAVRFLGDLIASGKLNSTCDAYLEGIRNPTGGVKTFYAKILREKGKEVAEETLELFAKDNHLRDFSGAIESIVVGMWDLARADPSGELVLLVNRAESFIYPFNLMTGRKGSMVIALNPEYFNPRTEAFSGSKKFSDDVPLLAVNLGVSDQGDVKIALVFATRSRRNEQTFTVIDIDRDGNTSNTTFTPWIDFDRYPLYLLGLLPVNEVVSCSSFSGGSMNNYLGFPDSDFYLARNISKIGPRLSEMAKHLADENDC